MKDPNNPCIFCKVRKEELQFENKLAYSSIDSYPVSKFHSLIVPKRHVDNYFELNSMDINNIIEKINKKESIYNLKTDTKKSKFESGQKLSISNLDELPTYIQDNKEKFKEWLA